MIRKKRKEGISPLTMQRRPKHQTTLIMLKKALTTIALSLSACESLPKFPEVVQYGAHADIKPPGYYGVDSDTGAKFYKPFTDPSMKGAQCLSPEDYKKSEDWVQSIVEIAKQHCE